MDKIIVAVVDGIVVPVTSTIPFLASSGILLGVFVLLWVAFAVAVVRRPERLDAAWLRLRRLPPIVQALAWLLFLPVLAGLWVWRRAWPSVARLAIIAGIAGWNVLVFLPAARV
ncbi:MAG TPA: hypothetical protein VEY67_06785 [Candidatus Dormibacteraeota bacterium]|nr:hypothetical protein [Candidatus Dormibacteraeota bacterium]